MCFFSGGKPQDEVVLEMATEILKRLPKTVEGEQVEALS